MTTSELVSKVLLWFLLGCSGGLLLVVSFRDVALRLLPNSASLALVLIAVLLRWRDGSLPAGVLLAATVFGIAYVCWRRGWVGGGDVKLLGACALLVPPQQVFDLVVLTTLAGGVLALGYLLAGSLLPRRRDPSVARPASRNLMQRLWRVERRRILRRAPLPYGFAIATAALILLAGATGPLGH